MLKRALNRLVIQPLHRQRRGMTLGTRTAVFSGDGGILLVRHRYSAGWHFPGGGVERGESLETAALREIREEAGIEGKGPLQLHGIFLNDRHFPGDHVACFVLRDFVMVPRPASLEIEAAQFFPLKTLPEDITSGTRRRIEEITQGKQPSPEW